MRTPPEDMKAKILAAADLFADVGLDATKMEDVAATTGVPKATLYYYFDGKEDILGFLFAEILDQLAAAIGQAVEGEGTGAERLRAVVVAHLRVIEAHPAASRALQFDLGRAARLPLIAERVETAFLAPVSALLAEGAADGSLRPVAHPRLAATAILGAVATVGINTLTLGGRRRTRHVPDELVEQILAGVAS